MNCEWLYLEQCFSEMCELFILTVQVYTYLLLIFCVICVLVCVLHHVTILLFVLVCVLHHVTIM